ncbi:MAG: isoprenyl transferase [Candidatus Omnitrophica bacterium]|nr:isoprenyl transferase [Candidatus Omnitrophota bacterium]
MAELIKDRIPKHVAIIMDGNGRWAKQRGLSRTQGHLEGVNRVDDIVAAASDLGIGCLTLYTFSTENWIRPESEVSMLMQTVVTVLGQKLKKLCENNVRFRMLGNRRGVPAFVLEMFDQAENRTKSNAGLILNIAFNYGARQEILNAVRDIAAEVKDGRLQIEQIDNAIFSSFLYTKDLPDPDLLIRTSGELRISNFLLWQLSYAEFYFSDKYWPDFTPAEFEKALLDYQRRERRFGNAETGKGGQR